MCCQRAVVGYSSLNNTLGRICSHFSINLVAKKVCAFLLFPQYSGNTSSTTGIDRNQTRFQTCMCTAAKNVSQPLSKVITTAVQSTRK